MSDSNIKLLTPADFSRPLQKAEYYPLSDPASKRSKQAELQQPARNYSTSTSYRSSSSAVKDLLKCGQHVDCYDDNKPSHDQNAQQPLVVGQPADEASCVRCKNRSALEEVIKRLVLNPHKIEANNKLLTELEDLERRRTATAAQGPSWKYAENCNTMAPVPLEADRTKHEPQKLPYASPPVSPTFQTPPAIEEDFQHHQFGDSQSNVHKHTQLLSELATSSPKIERDAWALQEACHDYMQERRTPRPEDLALDFSASDSDEDDDKYPFGRCYTGSPLLPRGSLDSDTSSNNKSDETGEEEAAGSLNYLGSIPQPHNGASVHGAGLELQLPTGINDRQISIQDTTSDEAIARALLEEANPSLPPAVNDSTGQTASDDEVVRRKPSREQPDPDYQIARMMQEDYDQELAQAIHQHEQSQGAEPHPQRQHPQNGARPMSAGSPRRTDTDRDPAVETFLARQRQREHYDRMQQEQQARQQRQAAAAAGGGDERMLVPQRSLTYEELTDLEDVPCGLSTTAINRICGSFEYQKGLPLQVDQLLEDSIQLECCICMYEFCDTNILRQLPCNHVFHRTCIDRWLKGKKTCPVCLISLE